VPLRTHHLSITGTDGIGATTTVLIDGEPARALTGLTLTIDADSLTRAELQLVMTPVQVDVDAVVTLLPDTVAQLIALGWTPPA